VPGVTLPSPSPKPSPARPPEPTPASTGAAESRLRGVRMLSPQPGQRVSGRRGVTISGIAGDLDGRRLRIFDFADNGMYYLVDEDGVDVGADGRWSLRYRGIGSGTEDIGRVFVMTAVLADAGCQRELAEDEIDRGDVRHDFRRLPEGCRIAARVSVVKVAP
jgi:hypothetical protein